MRPPVRIVERIVRQPAIEVVSETGENRGKSLRSRQKLRFGPFSIDPERRRLARGSVPLHLTPKAFDLIHLLVAAAPRVITKRELHEQLWPGTYVSDASLTGLVKELRRVLEDKDPNAPIVRTVHRVGYACALDSDVPRPEHRASCWLVMRDRRVALRHGENVIGRDPASDVWLDIPGISRRHARIVADESGVRLADLGSKNGTAVGDLPVQSEVLLQDGDRVTFGSTVAVFRISAGGMSTETRSRSIPQRTTTGDD